MTWDTLIDALAVIGAVSCLWFGVRGLLAVLGWVERSEIARQAAEDRGDARAPAAPAARRAVAAPAAAAIPVDHVAAIAAAVSAVGHRVVLINDIGSDHTWSAEGRWLHQTSHRPH